MLRLVKNHKYLNALAWFVLILTLFLTYYQLIYYDPFLVYDDNIAVLPLQNINGLQSYIDIIINGVVLDIAPVRDLTYIIDFFLVNNLKYWSFHFTNLIIWIITLFYFKKILNLFSDNSVYQISLVWLLVFLYAFSPVSTSSVAWLSARKHILSTLFILIATHTFLINRSFKLKNKEFFKIILLYIFSILSQPINVLWVAFVWVVSLYEKKFKEHKTLLLTLSLISLLGVLINLYYYSGPYVNWSMQEGKYKESINVGLSLLALGRYFYLTLVPFDASPVSHFQGSWQNIAGLFLLVLFGYLIVKKHFNKYLVICFFLYFFIPLVPVTYRITRIFCMDTYVLNASIGIYICLFFIMKNMKLKKTLVFLAAYILAMIIYNFSYANLFLDANKIWSFSYYKEPNTISIAALASSSIVARDHFKADQYIKELELLDPDHKFLDKLKIDNIYYNSKITNNEKIIHINKIERKVPYAYFILSILYSNENSVLEFKNTLVSFFTQPKAYINYSYIDNEKMVAFYKAACEKFQIDQECIGYFNNFTNQVTFKNWNQSKFEIEYRKNLSQINNLTY